MHKFYKKSKSKPKNGSNKYISIPYVQGLSKNIKNILRKHDIQVLHESQNALNTLLFTPLKSIVRKFKKSNLIYSISYHVCDKVYIGMTS